MMENRTGKSGSAEFNDRAGFPVSRKLVSIIFGLILLMAGMSAIGIYQMNKIGGELAEIVEHDLPLTRIVTHITEHQLEQAIALQRGLRYGGEMQTNPARRRRFDETVARFEEFARLADSEFVEARELVGEFLADDGIAEADRAEFEHVLAVLREIDSAHAEYEGHARLLIDQLRAGEVEKAKAAAEAVEAEEMYVDRELKALLEHLETYDKESDKVVAAHEKFSRKQIIGVSEGVAGMARPSRPGSAPTLGDKVRSV